MPTSTKKQTKNITHCLKTRFKIKNQNSKADTVEVLQRKSGGFLPHRRKFAAPPARIRRFLKIKALKKQLSAGNERLSVFGLLKKGKALILLVYFSKRSAALLF